MALGDIARHGLTVNRAPAWQVVKWGEKAQLTRKTYQRLPLPHLITEE
jgi:hypothetical protein